MLLNCGIREDSWESPLDCKEIQPVHPKGNQSWIFIGRTDAEAETPVLWPPDIKNWLIGKDPDAGKDCRWEEKGTTEDEISWMASPTQWTWAWVSFGSWWWTGKPGVQSMELQSWTWQTATTNLLKGTGSKWLWPSNRCFMHLKPDFFHFVVGESTMSLNPRFQVLRVQCYYYSFVKDENYK